MKKKLVAVAIAGLLAAPLAQAQTANVTLYGVLNMDLDFVSSAAEKDLGKLNRVTSNQSRLGFRGSESLGGGLKAIFQIESEFNESGAGALSSRDTFVGLEGGWGKVRLGNMLTPYNDAHAVFGNAPTYLAGILHTGALWAQWGNGKAAGGFAKRLGSSIRYDTPNISGFTGAVQYSTDETVNHGWVGGLGAAYKNAGLQLAVVYETNQDFRNANSEDQAFTVTGGYDFGIVRPALVYEYIEYKDGSAKLKRHLYGGSLTVPLGPGKLYGALIYADKGKGAAGKCIARLCEGSDTEAMQYEISYTYPLSKRTSVYAGYVAVDNENNSNYTFAQHGNANGKGVDQQGLVFGIAHFF
ncbi:MAG: porin [Burkholderiales bacterium]|jgi:predicted porin|nr:porin [Burkholderiales bacterium]